MRLREATRTDVTAFLGRVPPVTLRALVAEKDGAVVAIGGYYLESGKAVAFTDISPDLPPRDIVRAGRAFVDILRTLPHDVVAWCGEEGETALRHFGFRPEGPVWRLY